jgi:hypothetical protein
VRGGRGAGRGSRRRGGGRRRSVGERGSAPADRSAPSRIGQSRPAVAVARRRLMRGEPWERARARARPARWLPCPESPEPWRRVDQRGPAAGLGGGAIPTTWCPRGSWTPRSGSRPTSGLPGGGGALGARLRAHGRNVARWSDTQDRPPGLDRLGHRRLSDCGRVVRHDQRERGRGLASSSAGEHPGSEARHARRR